MLRCDRWLVAIVLLAMVSRVALISELPFGWDDSVYIMNAKYQLGENTYFEAIRPPILQTVLSICFVFFGMNEAIIRLLPLLVSTYSIILTYVFCKRFFGRNVAIIASAFLMAIPLHIEWSDVMHTEILSSVFILLSLYFYVGWMKNGKGLYLAVYLSAIAALTRFTAVTLFLAYVIFASVLEKGRIFKRKYIIAVIIFLSVNSVWLLWNHVNTGDWLYAYRWSLEWAGGDYSSSLFFLINALPMFSFMLFFILGGFLILAKNWRRKDYSLLLLFSAIFIGFHQMFVHKESRFLLPLVPVLSCIGAVFADSVRKRFKGFEVVLALFLIISFAQGFLTPLYYCINQAIVESSTFLAEQPEGRVMSMFWPITAYYSNYPVKAFPENPEEFLPFIEAYNISYIAVSDRYGWPDYAKNFTFFERDYLELMGTFGDDCQTIAVYKVI